MALYNGSEKVSSQISTAQYADVTDLMKHMTIEVGDIGQVMLPLNENENKRRYLNGQIILQEQFKKFTEKLKKAVSLYPTLTCTESQWQALRKADPDDQCAKFVIDNVNGTIRLPRVKYLVGSLNLYKFAEGMPNRRLVKIYKSGNNWYNWYSDGWIEQGGYFGATGSDVNTVVKLHKTMKDNKYDLHINMQWNGTGTAAWQYICGHNMTTAQFECTCQSSTYHNWVVRGYTSALPSDTEQYSNSIESQFESPYYIQVSTGVDYEVDVTNKITNNNPYAFGMTQRSNAKLNNVSWIESNGKFYSGVTYPDFYEWLLKNYNTPTDDISVKLNTASGITEYDYVINTADRTFKLPTLLGDEIVPNYSSRINATLPANPLSSTTTTWTAPYNGHLCLYLARNTAGNTINVLVNNVTYYTGPAWVANYINLDIPLNRGDYVKLVTDNTAATWNVARQIFVKAKSGYKHLYFYVGEAEQNLDLINVGNMAENFATISGKLNEIGTSAEYMSTVETQVNEISTVVNTFDTKMASVDEHVAELTTTVEGMADVQTQMGELSAQMDEVTIKMEEVNTVADNISNFTQRYLIEAWHEGDNWYNLYSDGWLEQGGLWSGSVDIGVGQEGGVTIEFFKPYKETYYYANASAISTYCMPFRQMREKSNVYFAFGAYEVDRTLNAFSWEAKGYTTLPTEQEPTDIPTEE